MSPDTIRDYLMRTAMDNAQAEALSYILAEMATSSDLHVLEERFENRLVVLEERFENRLVVLDERFESRLVAFEQKLGTRMADLRSDLTWRTFAIVGFFGTVTTILNAFIG